MYSNTITIDNSHWQYFREFNSPFRKKIWSLTFGHFQPLNSAAETEGQIVKTFVFGRKFRPLVYHCTGRMESETRVWPLSQAFFLLDSFDMDSLWFKFRLGIWYELVFDVLMPIVYLFDEEKREISFLNPVKISLPDWNKLFISKESTVKKLGVVATLHCLLSLSWLNR